MLHTNTRLGRYIISLGARNSSDERMARRSWLHYHPFPTCDLLPEILYHVARVPPSSSCLPPPTLVAHRAIAYHGNIAA